jgi:hypothetical protein
MINYTIQPNKVFDLKIMYEGKLILFYLNSKPNDWIIYKSEVRKTLGLGQTKMNAAWRQLIDAGFIIKTKSFGRVDFALHVSAINALMNGESATCESATRVNATCVSARIPITDVSPNTDVTPINDRIQNTGAMFGITGKQYNWKL